MFELESQKSFNDVTVFESGLEKLSKMYLDSLTVNQNSFKAYSVGLRTFLEYCQDNGVSKVNGNTIERFKYDLNKRLSCATVNLYLSGVKKFFRFLERESLYTDVAKSVECLKFNKQDRKLALTTEQVNKLLSVFDDTEQGKRNKAIVLLMAGAGLRDIEVSRLEIGDLGLLDGEYYCLIQGKGRLEKDECVFLEYVIYQAINEYLEVKKDKQTKYLFTSTSNNNKGGLTTRAISQVVKDGLRAIGIDSKFYTAHSLRHTAVTTAIDSGMDINEVKDFARHKSILTTQFYVHSRNVKANKIKCAKVVCNALFNNNFKGV